MSTPGTVVLLVGVSVGLAAGALRWRRAESAPPVRALVALGPLAAALVLVIVTGFQIALPNHDYGCARFATSASLVEGYQLYPPEDEGALLSAIYGPVSVLLFTPAALIEDVDLALIAAGTTSAVLLLGALLTLFLRGARGERSLAFAFAAFSACAMLVHEPVQHALGTVHVDAPALAFGALSCAALLGTRDVPGTLRLAFGALCVVLAGWTKQVDVPMALGQLVWLWIAFDRRAAGRYLVWLVVWSLVTTAAFSALFGFAEMWLNLVLIPGGHAFYPFGPIVREGAGLMLPFLVVIAWAAFTTGPDRPGRRLLAGDWGLLLIVAVFLVPTSFLARAKLGGFLNSWHSQFYLVAAAGLALRTTVAGRGGALARWRPPVALVLCVALFALLPYERSLPKYRFLREETVAARTLAFARERPHQVFFPWNPLVTLRSDGRLYHFEWGVRDRAIAGYRPSDAHVRAHLPEQLEYVVYPRKIVERKVGPRLVLLEYLPEFTEQVEFEGYPEWIGFARPEGVER